MKKKTVIGILSITGIAITLALLYVINGSVLGRFSNRQENIWKEDGPAWKVTQYGTEEDTQMMFYTVENSDGLFMIIDGGWNWNEEAVRKVIKEHDNHVDAWILTHPHPDHIGAFNAIMKNPGKVTVDMVYDVYIDLEEYRSVAREWDEISVYEDYLLMAFDAGFPVTHVERGMELNILGLKITCFNAYDNEVKSRTEAVCNNGSLMLKLEGREESFLFCSDVEDEMAGYLIETYGEQLKADYVQMSHHGNWGLTEEFYEIVSPKAAFFDGPASLYEESQLYDGWKLMNLMNEMGAQIYTFKTVPNSIILK